MTLMHVQAVADVQCLNKYNFTAFIWPDWKSQNKNRVSKILNFFTVLAVEHVKE
jgi:hypothetical protein